jgi:hypothetical protein
MLARAAATLLALLLLGGSFAFAQVGLVFNRTGSGARAAGMANAFIAVSDDGTAASWNGRPRPAPQARLSVENNTTGRLTAAGRTSMAARFPAADRPFNPLGLAVPVTLWGKAVRSRPPGVALLSTTARWSPSPRFGTEGRPILIDGNTDLVGESTWFRWPWRLTGRLAWAAA